MPSPRYSKTSPPKRSIAPPIRAIASRTMSRKSSGSIRSASEVEPTMSAKSAVTILRSSRRAGTAGTEASTAAPHSEQKRAPSVSAAPQLPHVGLTGRV